MPAHFPNRTFVGLSGDQMRAPHDHAPTILGYPGTPVIQTSRPGKSASRHTVAPQAETGPRLVTLGLVALLDDAGAPLLGPGKPLALLTYLRSIPGQSATREHLVDLLWADSDPSLGRQALRQTLLRLRQALGEHTFATNHDEVTLRLALRHDRDTFLRRIADGDLNGAFEAYTGSFFPGFASSGSLQFEHWVDAERAHLAGLYLRAGETLVRRQLETEPRDALRIARALHREAPESEAIWRLVLQAALSARELLQAHSETDALERWLRVTGRRPEPATAGLIRLVREEGAALDATRHGLGLVTELVGREREFAQLLAEWKEVSRGSARFLHFEAPAGHGKSRLLNDTAIRLRSMGVTVLKVAAHQGEQEMRYSLAAGTVRALAELPGVTGVSPELAGALLGLHLPLTALFPGASPPSAGADLLHQRSAALAELLSAVADERPLALFIDDLHWSDAESRHVLAGAANRLGSSRVLLVTAARPGGAGSPLVPAAPVRRLEPLSASECEALVAALATAPHAEWTQSLGSALWRASRGSPLLAIEALQLALERGDLAIRQGAWCSDDFTSAVDRLGQGDALSARLASLGPDEHRGLVALAIAASPVQREVLDASVEAAGRIGPLLPGLEARGYVARTDTGWITGHDEIASAVLRDVSEEEQRGIAASLGRALLAHAPDDESRLQRAARFLSLGGDDVSLAVAFRRILRLVRSQGDSRSAELIAAELIHAPAESARVARLVRTLPFGLRFGIRPARVATLLGGLAVLGVVALGPWRRAAPPPDVELLIPHGSRPGATVLAITPLRLMDWDRTRPIEPRSGHDLAVATGERRYDRLSVAPDGKRVAFTRLTGDSGLTDIYLQEGDGTIRRLTATRGDDVEPSWSPDGRFLVFSTSRWTPRDNPDADLAILDVATGQVRQLTRGPDTDRVSAWSPDGSRIAFIRVLERGDRTELCWVTFAGEGPHCRGDTSPSLVGLVGWYGPSEILAVRQDSAQGNSAIVRVEADGSKVVAVDQGPTSTAVASADGQWIMTIQHDEDAGRSWLRVFPTRYPDLARLVYPEGDQTLLRGATWRSSATDPPRFLDTVLVVPPVAMPVIGLPQALRAEGRSRDGRILALPTAALRWRASDTAVATIDSVTGILTPRRTGAVQVVVTAGGWRTGTIELQVGRPAAQPLDSIRWTAAEWTGWTPFGTPSPRTESLPGGGSALLTNGDEDFESGVVSTRHYAVSGGLGFDAMVSLPIQRGKWQQLKLGMGTSPTALRDGLAIVSQCAMTFPASEGNAYLDQMGLGSPRSNGTANGLSRLRDGAWHRLRIEVLPDGGCAFAADGKALWHSPPGFTTGDSVALFFLGHSVGARIMVGPVDVWRGARDRE